MATKTWNPFGVSMELTATGSSVTRKSATQYTVKINASWEVTYSGNNTNYGMYVSSGGSGAYIPEYDGEKHSSGSGSFTGTYSISGNGSATKSVTVTFKNYKTDTSTDGESSTTLSFDVSVPAWTSYTVSYNANEGSGAPTSQTKWKDQALTLSSTKPTRTGYTFVNWNTKSDGSGKSYSAGGSYTENSAATLYAIWRENILTVIYYGNKADGCKYKGDVVSIDSSKEKSEILVDSEALSSKFYYDTPANTGLADMQNSSYLYLTKTGWSSLGKWNTASDGSGKVVEEKEVFDTGQELAVALGTTLASKDMTVYVYAQWRENTLTAYYHSNGATSAFADAENSVDGTGADDVIVRTYSWTYTSDTLSDGLHNYSSDGSSTELARTRYDAVGYWGTAEEVYTKDDEGDEDGVISNENGIAVSENKSFASGQELAEAFGLTLEDGDKEINLYAQWILRASMVSIYLPDENGNIVSQRGLVHIYDDNGDRHYGILTVYTDEYDENGSNARVVI